MTGPTRRDCLGTVSTSAVAVEAPVTPAGAQAQPTAPAQPALDDTARLLKALSEAPGPSAFEEDVRRIVVSEYSALGASIEYDGLGSVLATLPGNTSGPRVMVTAHMDEVGLIVQHITPDGFIRVMILGGILEQAHVPYPFPSCIAMPSTSHPLSAATHQCQHW